MSPPQKNNLPSMLNAFATLSLFPWDVIKCNFLFVQNA